MPRCAAACLLGLPSHRFRRGLRARNPQHHEGVFAEPEAHMVRNSPLAISRLRPSQPGFAVITLLNLEKLTIGQACCSIFHRSLPHLFFLGPYYAVGKKEAFFLSRSREMKDHCLAMGGRESSQSALIYPSCFFYFAVTGPFLLPLRRERISTITCSDVWSPMCGCFFGELP